MRTRPRPCRQSHHMPDLHNQVRSQTYKSCCKLWATVLTIISMVIFLYNPIDISMAIFNSENHCMHATDNELQRNLDLWMIGLHQRWVQLIFCRPWAKNYEYRSKLSRNCVNRWILVRGHYQDKANFRVNCYIVGCLFLGPPVTGTDELVCNTSLGWKPGRKPYPILDRVLFPRHSWVEIMYKQMAPMGVRVERVLQDGELDYRPTVLHILQTALSMRQRRSSIPI